MKQKLGRVDPKKILGYVGMILHVPGFMAIISLVVSLIMHEDFAVVPFVVTAALSIGVGQLLWRTCPSHDQPTLWDSMAIAALSWVLCPLFAAIPFYWISYIHYHMGDHHQAVQTLMHPVRALFEAFSGFTGSGLTMVEKPSNFPYSIIWWRSFTQWIGGVGLIVFIISLMENSRNRFHLYYAEARSEILGKNLKDTTNSIWTIYITYTVCAIVLFALAGMPVWEAINNAMTTIATGGYSTNDDSFASYNSLIKVAAIIVMLAGAISFVVHYQLVRYRDFKSLWTSLPHRFMLFMFLIGGALVIFIDHITFDRWDFLNTLFMWVSAMTTTGLSVENLSVHAPVLKIFFMIAMLIGGSAGSTAGGLKIQRFMNLFSSMIMRVKSIFDIESSRKLKRYLTSSKRSSEPGMVLPQTEQAKRLFAAGVLFFLWVLTLFIGWLFVAFHIKEHQAFNSFFDVVSAMSNVGLSVDVVSPALNPTCLIVFMVLMWLGRVEIIPAIILLISFFRLKKRKR